MYVRWECTLLYSIAVSTLICAHHLYRCAVLLDGARLVKERIIPKRERNERGAVYKKKQCVSAGQGGAHRRVYSIASRSPVYALFKPLGVHPDLACCTLCALWQSNAAAAAAATTAFKCVPSRHATARRGAKVRIIALSLMLFAVAQYIFLATFIYLYFEIKFYLLKFK